MRMARLLAVVYLLIGAVMFSIQTRIIFPGHETQGQRYAEVRPRRGTELVHLQTPDGLRIVALYGPALATDGRPDPHAADRPTLLYFYGNGMCLSFAEGEFERFRRLPRPSLEVQGRPTPLVGSCRRRPPHCECCARMSIFGETRGI